MASKLVFVPRSTICPLGRKIPHGHPNSSPPDQIHVLVCDLICSPPSSQLGISVRGCPRKHTTKYDALSHDDEVREVGRMLKLLPADMIFGFRNVAAKSSCTFAPPYIPCRYRLLSFSRASTSCLCSNLQRTFEESWSFIAFALLLTSESTIP